MSKYTFNNMNEHCEQLKQLKHSKNPEMHTLFSVALELNCKEKII